MKQQVYNKYVKHNLHIGRSDLYTEGGINRVVQGSSHLCYVISEF